MNATANQNVRSATVEATITRADGSVERLGVISRYDGSVLGRVLSWIRGVL